MCLHSPHVSMAALLRISFPIRTACMDSLQVDMEAVLFPSFLSHIEESRLDFQFTDPYWNKQAASSLCATSNLDQQRRKEVWATT